MFYAYASPTVYGVTENFGFIENVVKKVPYHTFRSFRSEEEAWLFVSRRKHGYGFNGIFKYGDIFDEIYATVNYLIYDNVVKANVDISRFGYVRLDNIPDDVDVEYNARYILVSFNMEGANNDSLVHHSSALYRILKTLGQYMDINLVVESLSIFYLLTAYTGSKFMYRRLINLIEERSGKVAYTYTRKIVEQEA